MNLIPQVEIAIDRLHASGFEAYLVGGAVRDYVRGVENKDWDITTDALPEQVVSLFSDFRVIETGLKHGTVTVVIDHEPLEITTFRVDGAYSDHRHPDSVSFTRNLREDLARRDFTMNAMAYNPDEGVVDLYGGREDLARRVIRCVGDPRRRFEEDALRILRALRFSAVLDMALEPDTARAALAAAPLLRDVAPERIRVELTKLLCGKAAGQVLREYREIVAQVIPELSPMFDFEQHNPHHDKDVWEHTIAVVSAISPEPVLRWAALLHDVGKPECFTMGEDGIGHFYAHGSASARLTGQILRSLRFDNASGARITMLVERHDIPIVPERRPVKRLINRMGVEGLRQLILLHRADTKGQSALSQDRYETFDRIDEILDALLQEEACFSLKDLAINGSDLIALGLQGKAIGAALNRCLDAVLDELVPNEKTALLRFLNSDNFPE